MKKLKKSLLLLITGIIIISSFTGCNNGKEDDSDKKVSAEPAVAEQTESEAPAEMHDCCG